MKLAVVYSRMLGDSVLTLASSGWTYKRTFVLWDYETGSMWFPFDGTGDLVCISGKLADRTLKRMPFFVGSWEDWKSAHQGMLLMKGR